MNILLNDRDLFDRTLLFTEHLGAEVARARIKWPGNADKLAAMSEEAGEVARAMLRHKHEGGSAAEVWREAVQLAAMALRVATEGTAEMPYRPGEALAQFAIETREKAVGEVSTTSGATDDAAA